MVSLRYCVIATVEMSMPNIQCTTGHQTCAVSGGYNEVVNAIKNAREYMIKENLSTHQSFNVIARSVEGPPGMEEALQEVTTPTYSAMPEQPRGVGNRGRSSSSDGIVQVMPDIPERRRVFSFDGSDEQKGFYEEWHSQY
ncbi:hypothetical protein FOL47_003848 [Perkinsus chesapeaki]|uniref:Uncharacterized protein n=1 Tax=Perkinsus chesapeaki TaxID=330153 RepID=A0A7J6M5Q7_PERCH|nr:hypothetical protein FOL47_003848 [Perkinsus chesapeaki]